jgi:hypothetical protein
MPLRTGVEIIFATQNFSLFNHFPATDKKSAPISKPRNSQAYVHTFLATTQPKNRRVVLSNSIQNLH